MECFVDCFVAVGRICFGILLCVRVFGGVVGFFCVLIVILVRTCVSLVLGLVVCFVLILFGLGFVAYVVLGF